MPTPPYAVLAQRARYFFDTWARPVLACDGDPEKERATLRRPGVAAARNEYDHILEQMRRKEARSSQLAFFQARASAFAVEAALAER